MINKVISILFLTMTIMTGCSIQQPKTYPLSADLAVQNVCIEKNSTTQFEEMLSAVQNGFARHGISSRVFSGDLPEDCIYTAKYSAVRGWDLKFYLKAASVTMFQNKNKVAGFGYLLDGPFSKFGSLESKIDPRMDEMLMEYPLQPGQ